VQVNQCSDSSFVSRLWRRPREAVYIESRMNQVMLADLRIMGVYLVPGVPNTTHVTQETDLNYGPFKTQHRSNLESLAHARYQRKVSVKMTDFPLLVFGGTTSDVDLKDAFSKSFDVAHNLLSL
jgi:hypothetical protein